MSQNENEAKPPPSDFISKFITFYEKMESPTSFWRWAAYATVAAVLRDKCYFEFGAGRVYPNIYVILLADSAEYRKGAPIVAARNLLNLVKVTKVFSGTASIQGILDDLSQDVVDRSTGVPIKGGSAIITADEFAAFFVNDPRLLPLITNMWDYYDEFPYKLKGGSVIIKNLCLSLLAASNETFLREVYDSRAVYGGLLGRTFMIKPDETRKPNSLMYMENLERYDKTPLVNDLKEIRKLNGPIRKTKVATEFYHNWYEDLYKKYKKHPDRTGVLQRMHTNAIKLAIILAAANFTLEITDEIFKEAIYQVTQLRENYEIYVMSAGKSNFAEIGAKFLAALWESETHEISRKDFLGKNWAEVTAEDFDKLLQGMVQGNIIDTTIHGVEIGYKLTIKGIEIFKKHEEKKEKNG